MGLFFVICSVLCLRLYFLSLNQEQKQLNWTKRIHKKSLGTENIYVSVLLK